MFSPRNVSRGVTSGKRLGVARVISLQNSFAKGFSIIGLGILFFAMLMVFFSQKSLAQTQQNPPSFNYQGRLLNATGTAALTGPVDIELQIWDSSGAACLLYVETHQNYDLGSNGLFNFRVGTVVGDAVRGGVISGLADPAIQMQRVYSNTGQARAPGADCAAGYTPTATEGRVMKVITRYPAATGPVAALTPDQYINSVPYAIVAETLQGYSPSDLVKRAGGAANRMQGDLELGDGATNYKVVNLADPGLGTRDAVNQSYADTRYAIKGANNTFTNDIYVNGRIGVGTTSPSADVEIERAGDATFRLYSSLSGGEKTAIQFYGGAGATETASIESANNSNNLFFYTGAAHTQALQLNNTQATFAGGIVTGGSIAATGTIQPGAYSAAGNEPALLTALGLLPTASRQGVMWYESDNDKLRFWSEGVGAKTLATEDYVDGNYVATVTAGTGLNNTGTVGNDIVLNTTFGYGASQSLQGNSTFGDDVSRTATAGTVGLQVDKIQGRTLDFTGLVSGDVLRVDGAGNFVRSNLSDKLSIDGSISMTGTLTTRAGTAAPNTAPIKIPVTSVNGPGGLGEAGSIYFDGSNLSYVDSAGAVNTISVGGAGTYLPLAGGTMTGAISMGGAGGPYKITSLADGTVASDAVNYGQITAIMATNDTNFVRKDGSTALTSNWDLNGVTPGGTILLTGLQDPAVADGAATKGYVDTAITGLNIGNYVLRDGTSTLTGTWDVDGAGAGTGKIRGLDTPTNDDDAARKKYVDDSITALGIGNYVLRDGTATMSGNWNFSDGVANRRITNLADPSAAQDAATKNYVDTNFATITNVSTNYLNKDGSTQMDASAGLKFGKYANDAARPAGFVEGQTAYNQTRKTLEVYDGASWVTLSTGGAGAYVTSDGTTPLTGSWDIDGAGAGTGTITGLATPVADADAARKKYVDDSITGLNIGNYVLRDGTATMTGDWNFSDGANNRKITNLANPAAAQDAATKNYVDTQFAGGVGGAIAGDVTGTLSASSVDKIKGKTLDATVGAANNGDFLVYDSAGAGSWKAVAAGTAETDPQVSMTTPLRLSVWNAGGTSLVDSPFGVDGSNNLDMNGQKITDLGVPTVSSDAVRKDYVDALFPSQSGGLGVLSGDVSGATNATVVDKIKGKPVNAAATADGQVLIYDQTAGEYFNRTLTGTANQVNVTNGAGTITLALPQNINTAATPTFSDLTLSSFGAGVVKSDGSGNLSSGTITVSDISDISTNYLPLAGGTMNAGSRITVAAGAAGQQGLKLTAGTNLAAPVAGDSGSIEYNGTSISYIDSTGARQTLSTAVAGGYLPLSGGTMTGAINAGGFAMTNLADPTGAQDAATKNYVDTNFTNNTGLGNTYVKRDGSSTLTAAWDIDGAGAGTGTIRGLATPTNDDDAARKKYVDDSITGLGIGNYVLRDGTSTLTADWDIDGAGAGTRKIIGLATPTQSDGASTKGYVDSLFAGGTGGSIAGDVTGTLSASTVGKIQGVTVDSTAPTDAKFLVYDGVTDNRYEAVALSGDATMSNTGALTLKNTGTAGTYTKVTTDAQGRITSGSNLVAGDIPDLSATYLPLAGGTMNAGSRITVAAGAAGQQGLKLTAGTNLAAPVAGDSGSIEYDGTSVSYIDSTGARRTIATSATAGETNDGANVGAGIGIFKDKSGVNLRFKSLQAASTKLSVAANGSGNEVDIDVNEANLTHDNIGGTLGIAKGGTGQTTANAAFNALAPAQATNGGKFLQTDGTNTSWVTALTSYTETDPTTLKTTGAIPRGNAGGTAQEASNLTDASGLVTSAVPVRVNNGATSGGSVRLGEDSDNGTNYVALKAPDTLGSDITLTLPTNIVDGGYLTTNASGQLSWGSPSGSVTSVGASAPLESSGGATPTISFVDGTATGKMLRSVNAAEPAWSTATFADTYAASTLLYSNGANNVVGLATANDSILTTNGTGVPTWASSIGVAQGGTGLTSGTSGGIPYFNSGTTMASSAALTQYGVVLGGGAGGAPTSTAAGTNGQFLVGVTGANPAFVTMSGDATTTNAGLVTVNNLSHDLSMSNDGGTTKYKIINVADPTAATDAATRGWVLANLLSSETDPQVGAMNNNRISKWNGTALVDSNLSDDGTTVSSDKTFAVNNGATSGGSIRVLEDSDNGANYVAIKSPDTLGSDITLTLPTNIVDGGYLTTNASGQLSWGSPSGAGDLTEVQVGTGLTVTNGTGPIPTVSLGTELAAINGLATTGFVKRTGAGAYSTSSSIDLSADVGATVLPLANGGTSKALTAANGGIIYSDADSMEVLAATATAGQILRSGANSAPSWSLLLTLLLLLLQAHSYVLMALTGLPLVLLYLTLLLLIDYYSLQPLTLLVRLLLVPITKC
ncbi:MAG: hypothetical protein IPM57_06700 [Oligoflexia bacterium]|nr:hypothetical protein [Oligoflexia bacterium]